MFNSKAHVLTNDQANAYNEIRDWYNSKETIFTLSGYAGSGKTFLINKLLETVFKQATCVTAPTHRALRVLEGVTGRKGKTLHSLHGLRQNANLDDFDINNIPFDPIGLTSMKNFKLIICDECGQINTGLHTLNTRRSIEFNTKILYTGDSAQLPPVKERISPTFLTANKAELIELVRQDVNNPLVEALTIARYDVTHGTDDLLKYIVHNKSKINDKGEGFTMHKVDTFAPEIVTHFNSDLFANNINYIRYLSYTNDNITLWNKYIRDDLFKNTTAILTIHDLLIGYKTIVDAYNNVIIANSEDYIVLDVVPKYSDDKFKVYICNIIEVATKRTVLIQVVDHTDATFNRFVDRLNELRYNFIEAGAHEKRRRYNEYLRYKDDFLLMIDVNLAEGDEPDWIAKRDIDYGYGVTVHKSQGTTLTDVAVNLLDVCFYNGNVRSPRKNSPKQPYAVELKRRMLYTALSRAKRKAIVLL